MGEAVELGGAVEGEGGRGTFGGDAREVHGAVAGSRGVEVVGGPGVAASRLEGEGELAAVDDELLRNDLGQDGGADAVVVALDGVRVAGPSAGAHEVLRTEDAERGGLAE
ncbi:hypothetical protein [Nannocystis sp.]|uniref:hypothetical protein n=1 Tax=Nannocystis sp. TaxID=1962667 RepID=UPI0025D5FCFA|nr:hypothetical protein [Nannocystis sp.]